MSTAAERRERLKAVYEDARGCVRCPLHQTRTQVVFGAGNANADLMFIGEAPGANEDRLGLPFVGQAGKLLDKLLGEIGLRREDVFIANTLKCLKSTAMVQLGDGSWERIGRLVRTRYDGDVMSVDSAGRLVARRVVGWHSSPLGDRRVFRLTPASAKAAGASGVGVELTGDHPVLTQRGYVPVERLRRSDRIATGHGLSEIAHDVVCGTLLGDGAIGNESAALTFTHSQGQADYAGFKAGLLQELSPAVSAYAAAAVPGGGALATVAHVRTVAQRSLALLRSAFYASTDKRVPPRLAAELSPRMLAIWFMDDGYTKAAPGRGPSAEIATVRFSDDDLQTLIAGLARLGLPAKGSRGRLYFGPDATQRLSELIAPYVPAPMRFKLIAEVAERVPFDASLWEVGPARVVYDEVRVQDVTDQQSGDSTFFCLDVEQTHNFVTAGGVVHNCRPPDNRDPHPNEIAACQDYLRSQVALIEPVVICTLGNFATKLLRADTTGISRLHGHAEERIVGARAVRLYPLYHPAAGLYTPSMLATLRADFQRIPELLALGPPAQPPPPEPVPELEEPPEIVVAPAVDRAPEASTGEDAAELPGPMARRAQSVRAPEAEPVTQLGLF